MPPPNRIWKRRRPCSMPPRQPFAPIRPMWIRPGFPRARRSPRHRARSKRCAAPCAPTSSTEYATIQAPISGLIGDTLVPVGGLVNATSPQPLTTIVPVDPMWVRFKVTESEYLAFKKRGNLTQSSLTLILADGTQFPSRGRVENTVNEVDSKTGTLELQARFPNPRHFLLPGQFGRVRIETEVRKGVMLIPQRAVQQLQNMQTVLLVGSGNKVEAAVITTSERAGDNVIVDRGVKPGDRVIVEGQLKVRPGMTVAPSAYQAAVSVPGPAQSRGAASAPKK